MSDDDEELSLEARALPPDLRRYLTPGGHAKFTAELNSLLYQERPKIVQIVSWAAGNGDRSENGDYQYGKKRLREIDRRVHFLQKRLDRALVIDPAQQTRRRQIFFGATVIYMRPSGEEKTITIVGVDEADFADQQISLASPIARAILGAEIGAEIPVRTPQGVEILEIIDVRYPPVTDA
jgi:transcription elongation factor GreB